MESMKTPGVYIKEINAFPNSVVPVATAVPAFIGHTQFAMNGTKSLLNQPFRITSMLEYNQYFGGAPQPEYTLNIAIQKDLDKNDKDLKDINVKIAAAKSSVENAKKLVTCVQCVQKKAEMLVSAITQTEPDIAAKADDTVAVAIVLQNVAEEVKDSVMITESNNLKVAADAAKIAVSTPDAEVKAKAVDEAAKATLVKAQALLTTTTEQAETSLKTLLPQRKVLADSLNAQINKLFSVNDPQWKIEDALKILNTFYYNLVLFFANGGGACYIVSVGDYSNTFSYDSFKAGLAPLTKEAEPTMLVIPEAVNLGLDGWANVIQDALQHCGKMKNRVAILDIFEGYKSQKDPSGDVIKNFREKVGSSSLDFAAAYYPWINTSVVSTSDINAYNLTSESATLLLKVMQYELDYTAGDAKNTTSTDADKANILLPNSPFGNLVMKEISRKINLLPVAAAMAGIYTKTDSNRGVWKAPANISVNMAASPALNLTDAEQEGLNVDLNGRSINAIRYFKGEGTKVWGARTLMANSLDWRYINVRRTMIFLEESIKNAARAYVFEPNVAATWLNMKAMIENFLLGVWKQGGLAGASPEDAYSVHVGLGDTMTPEDILEGILRITVLVAVSHPAEFIEITFQQQMQKS